MFDKSLKCVEELTEIIKSAYKNGLDKETFDAKLSHIQEKINHLKDNLQRNNAMHKKEIKQRNKQISRLQSRQRTLEEKIENILQSRKQGSGHMHYERRQNFSAGFYLSGQQEKKKKTFIEEQSKQRQMEEQLQNYKIQVNNLQEKLAQFFKQNEKLKKENQSQRFMLEAFITQGLLSSEDEENSSEGFENEENLQIYEKVKEKVMDMPERQSDAMREQQQQIETDDQCQIMAYQSDLQEEPPQNASKKSERLEDKGQVEVKVGEKKEEEWGLQPSVEPASSKQEKSLPWWLSFLKRFCKND